MNNNQSNGINGTTRSGNGSPEPAVNLASNAPLRRRLAVKTGDIELPPQNADHIATLALSDEPDGREKIVQYARRTIGKLFGPELTELQTISRQGHDNLRGIRKQIAELTQVLNSTRRYNETDRQSEPWTWFDKMQAVVLAVISIILMLVGINSMATVLLESGLRAFENPWCRYLFSMIPLALPFAFKYLSRQFTSHRGRAAYHTVVWLGGILFAVLWAVMFASTFNGITQSASDLASALTLNQTESTGSNHKWLLMVISLMAESLLAAGCWLTIESIVEKHESSVRAPNPAYEHTQAEMNHWRSLEAEEEEYLGKVDGRMGALQDAMDKYAADAEAIYIGKKYATGAREEVKRIVNGNDSLTPPTNPRRRIKTTLALAIGLIGLGNAALAGQTFVLGIAPDYERGDKELVYQKLVQFTLEGAKPGDKLAIYDALGLQPITSLEIPEGSQFQNNPRARLQRLSKEIGALKRFFVTATNVLRPEMIGAINVPEFLGLVSTHLRRSGERTVVILIGSAFYMDPEGNFSMNDAFPSDAHLSVDQRESVFGVAAKKQALTGIIVHYAYLHEAFLNDYHKERLSRFWNLFLSEQGATLASFASNIDLVLHRVKEDLRQPFMTAKRDPEDTKIEMRHVMPRAVPAWFPPTNSIPSVSVTNVAPVLAVIQTNMPAQTNSEFKVPVLQDLATNVPTTTITVPTNVPPANGTAQTNVEASPEPPRTLDPLPIPQTTGDAGMGIGIMWSLDKCDLDLYVQANPNAKELYYSNRSTREGKYFHDYRNRNDKLDFEYVELNAPVDASKVRAWVNFYQGHATDVKGLVVVRCGGKSSTREFTIKATQGNQGADKARRRASSYWVDLNIPRIVGLRASPRE